MTSPCPHISTCGGCRLQHLDAPAYGAWKTDHLKTILTQANLPTENLLPLIITAPATRRRARLAVEHTPDGLHLGFNVWRSHDIVNLQACPVLLPELENFIPALREALAAWLPQGEKADVQLTALPEGLDVTLIGGPEPSGRIPLPLREGIGEGCKDSGEAFRTLAQTLDIAQLSWRKWDRSPPQRISQRRPLTVRYGYTNVPFPPASFLQATQAAETALIAFAKQAVGKGAKVLDLFCGLGAFGLSMTQAQRVAFADLDGPAVAALAKTVTPPRYDVEKRNLIAKPFTAAECNPFDVVIFDPPRGGAKAQAEQLAQSYVPEIIAISCDPPTFTRDAKILLAGGYKLQALQPVDQFLWSTHLEVAGWFAR